MNLNSDRHGQLEILEGELSQWLDLHERTNSDPETAEKYRQIVARIQEALMAATIMEDNDVIVLIITDSEIKSGAIKAKLIEVTQNLTEEDRENVERSIQDIIAFEDRTNLLEAESSETIKPENHIRLILKIITDKGGLVYNDDLENGYDAYRRGDLPLGPSKKASGLGTSFKTTPFEFLSEHLQKALEERCKVFSAEGQTIWVNTNLPLNFKAKVQLFSIKLALSSNQLANDFGQLLRDTTTFNSKGLKTSVTAASGVVVFDFGWFKVMPKIDFLKFEKDRIAGKEKFEMLSVVGQVDFNPEVFDRLAQLFGEEEGIKMVSPMVTPISIKFDVNVDALAFAQKKMKDAALKKIDKEKDLLIREAGEEAVEELDKMKKASKELIKDSQKIVDEGLELQKLQKDRVGNYDEIMKREGSLKKYSTSAQKHAKSLKEASSKLDNLIKGKKAPLIRAAKSKVLGTTAKIIRSNAIRAVGKVAAKFVPILNLISLAYDIYSIVVWLDGYMQNEFRNASLARSAVNEMRSAQEAAEFRKAAEKGSTIKKFVILAMYETLPRYDNSYSQTNHNMEPFRYPVYLKFYEDSSVGREFFNEKKYKDRAIDEGVEEQVGLGEKIDFDYIKLGDSSSPPPKFKGDTNFGKLDLGVFDEKCFKSHRHYKYLQSREQLGVVSGVRDYIKAP